MFVALGGPTAVRPFAAGAGAFCRVLAKVTKRGGENRCLAHRCRPLYDLNRLEARAPPTASFRLRDGVDREERGLHAASAWGHRAGTNPLRGVIGEAARTPRSGSVGLGGSSRMRPPANRGAKRLDARQSTRQRPPPVTLTVEQLPISFPGWTILVALNAQLRTL